LICIRKKEIYEKTGPKPVPAEDETYKLELPLDVFPASNIHEALRWIDVCYSLKHPEEMKVDGDEQKPLEHLPADTSGAIKPFYYSSSVSLSGY
jgi:hypothetical protein